MATTGTTIPPTTSSYRIKFDRQEFLKLIDEAKPDFMYKVKDFIYFAFDGFVMYCDDLTDDDLVGFKIFNAIEFSNQTWTKTDKGLF